MPTSSMGKKKIPKETIKEKWEIEEMRNKVNVLWKKKEKMKIITNKTKKKQTKWRRFWFRV